MTELRVPPAIAKISPNGNLTPRQLRRFMIDMVLRRVKPGTGSGHDFMRRRTAINPWPDLRPILKGIQWALFGGVATRAYMAERVTKDMDLLVREKDGELALQKLQEAGFRISSQLAIPEYLMVAPDGTELDVLLGKFPWLDEALSNPNTDPAGYPVIALPYLVILKMAAQRPQDWADISRMLGWASDVDLNQVRAVVAKYTPEDIEDLESLIFIGKKEKEIPPRDGETD